MNFDMDFEKFLSILLRIVSPQRSDAIVWLQGDGFERGGKVLDLYLAGWSDLIILSGNNFLLTNKDRPGETNVFLEDMKHWLCGRGVKEDDIIIESESMHTKDQADHVVNLAQNNSLNKILLVASEYHQMRAFLTFLKSAQRKEWNGIIINQPLLSIDGHIPEGRAEDVKVLYIKEKEKIKIYRDDLATREQGVRYILSKCLRLSLRSATLEDSKFLFEIRNDPTTRKYSFQQSVVVYPDHLQWLKNSLDNPNRFLFIGVDRQGERIGQVRFDIQGSSAEISVSISPSFRGCGYGVEFVVLATIHIFLNHKKITKIVARIKNENVASFKIFEKAGYRLKNMQYHVSILEFNSVFL